MWRDDNDEEFQRALEESLREYEEVELPRQSQRISTASPINISDEDSLPGPSTSTAGEVFKRPFPCTTKAEENVEESELYDGPEAKGFDIKAGHVWVYPTSDKYPVRTYQREIVEKALFTNTLVSLPTGLGKTFIAAVVMYNFYKWYPNGKIIFMAPTKPLVAQQIENCINIVGIPESHTAEMTGALSSKMRAVMWKEKRVFFLTPQCVQNDLTSNVCPANDVKCVVIDEAHRALGDHAYAQVIRILNSYEARFRVLALSATPGSDLEAVQKVICNLMISHIELRGEDSQDIVKYTHQRNLELMVVDVGPTINRIRVKLVAVGADYAKYLLERKLLFGNMTSLARYSVLKEWENFRHGGSKGMDPAVCNRVNAHFSIVHTFAHGLELLQTYGLRLLLNHLKGALNKGDVSANRLSVNEDLTALMEEIESVLNPVDIDVENDGKSKKRFIYGHPKLDRLQEIVVSHFEEFAKKGEATRTIVFCEYREGVIEICDMLKHFQPLVKPVAFMGQSAGKTSKGITQKQQLEIMEKFKKGIYNTLISTSVGEEGLDIGEVDLIICFDAKNSPIRQVQRMGRTGRKRQGRIIMLVTRGKEELKYNQGLFKKKSVSSVLLNKENLASHLLEESPRMLPPGVEPVYTERKVVQGAPKLKSNQQDLRKMFLKQSKKGSATTSKPATSSKIHLGKSPFLSKDEFEELQLTWNNVQECCTFDRIPKRTEFWSKSAADVETQDLAPNNVDLATYLEYMRYQQRTHVIGNSSDSHLLSKLLIWAEDRRDNEQSALCGGLSSQVTSTQIWPTKSKKRGRNPASDSKAMNPPKKRGRPKKDTPFKSPLKPKENNLLEKLFTPIKPKSKAQFIDDDDYDRPDASNVSPKSKPSTSVFLTPSPLLGPSKAKTRMNGKCSVGVVEDVITIDSEGEDDLDSSSSSSVSHMSSEPSRQELFSELSRALKDQAPEEDEDECIICDNLFSCQSLNQFVIERRLKDMDITWSNVRKSLEDALFLVPTLTEEALAKYHRPVNENEKLVSLLPKFEIAADDDICDGMLCGGVGDFSRPRSISPQNNYLSQHRTVNSPKRNGEGCVKIEFEDNAMDLEHSRRELISPAKVKSSSDEIFSACSTPRRDLSSKAELSTHNEWKDVSFDFLGLSNINDIFGSQNDFDEKKIETLIETPLHSNVLEISSTKTSKSSEEKKLSSDLVQSGNLYPGKGSTEKSMCGSFKQGKDLCASSLTPTKERPAAVEQVSPILCSQATKKPRQALRIRKLSSLIECVKPEVYNVESNDSFTDSNYENHNKHQYQPATSEAEVTSSSNFNTGRSITPPEVNFDLCDDSLFLTSDEDSCNKSKVDGALKEKIKKKALEAKVKQSELTFTQEVHQMCETTSGGLTQIMELFAAKEKSPKPKIERADSMSSPQTPRGSPCLNAHIEEQCHVTKCDYNNVSFKSEDDLFAEYDDDDSEFLNNDNVISVSLKPPATPEKCVKSPVSSPSSKDNCYPSIIDRSPGKVKEEIIPIPDESLSPVFKSSQMGRRPSKLSLKKKTAETLNFTEQSNEENAAALHIDRPRDKFQFKILPLGKEQVNETKQLDLNSQIDFGMFGDEFNNSWSLSPSKTGTHRCLNTSRSPLNGTSVPNKQSRSLSSNPSQSGWISTSKSTKQNLDLSDFCDDSLLEALDSNTSETTVTRELPSKKKLSLGQKTTPICQGSERTSLKPKAIDDVEKEDNVILISSSDDENFNLNHRKSKKCQLNVTSSSEEGILERKVAGVSKTAPVENSTVMKKRTRDDLQSSSSSEKNHFPARRTKMPKTEETPTDTAHRNGLNLLAFCDESVVDTLIDDKDDGVQTVLTSDDDDAFMRKNKKSTKAKKKPRKRKKLKKGNDFILSEADESDGNFRNSSDGESTSLDEFDASFINDCQPEASQSVVDIQAKYLQSLRSPAGHAGKFKIPSHLPQMDINVYSQYPDADELEQTYADDSFCNDDEPTQYVHDMSVLEIAEARLKAERREKRKLKKSLKSGSPVGGVRNLDSNDSEEEIKVKPKRLKRIRVLEETMYENEDVLAEKQQPGPAPIIHVVEKSPESRAVSVSENKNDVKTTENEDFAMLLEDDLDFSAIPDIPDIVNAVTKKDEAPKPMRSFKFVKKAPMLLSDGSTVRVNPQSSWNSGTNKSNIQHNLQPTSKQAAVVSSGPSLSRNSYQAPVLQQRPASSATSSGSMTSNSGTSSQTLIIASSRQVAASPDLMRVLRVNYLVKIVPQSVPDADFIISWRLGVSRIFASDLRDKKKLEELVKKLKSSYTKPHLIVESDRIKSLAAIGQKKGNKAKVTQTPSTQSPWTSTASATSAALLRQAGILLLFSQNFDESARFLAKLARKETDQGHGIPEVALNLSDEVETRLLFFCSLPCVNYALALKLVAKFVTLSDCFASCSSVPNISTNLGVDLNAAQQIHKVLCEVQFCP